MKKVIMFYLSCCISFILLGLATNFHKIGDQGFRYGLCVFLFFVIIIYVPLCTIIAWILYFSKINQAILSSILCGIIYCLFPSLVLVLADALAYLNRSILNYIESDYIFYEIFAIQNIIIVGYGIIKRFKKRGEAQRNHVVGSSDHFDE